MTDELNPYAAGNLVEEPALVEASIPLSPIRRKIGKWALCCSGLSLVLSLLGPVLLRTLGVFVPVQFDFAWVAAILGLIITSISLSLFDLWYLRPQRRGVIMLTFVLVAISILGVVGYWMNEFRDPANET